MPLSNLATLAQDAARTPITGVQGLLGFLSLLTLVAVVAIMFPAARKVQAVFAPCVIIITIALTVLGVGALMVLLHRLQPMA